MSELGCGKKDLESSGIFRIFKGEEGGVSLLLYYTEPEINLVI
jgi:hypothetical protein